MNMFEDSTNCERLYRNIKSQKRVELKEVQEEEDKLMSGRLKSPRKIVGSWKVARLDR